MEPKSFVLASRDAGGVVRRKALEMERIKQPSPITSITQGQRLRGWIRPEREQTRRSADEVANPAKALIKDTEGAMLRAGRRGVAVKDSIREDAI